MDSTRLPPVSKTSDPPEHLGRNFRSPRPGPLISDPSVFSIWFQARLTVPDDSFPLTSSFPLLSSMRLLWQISIFHCVSAMCLRDLWFSFNLRHEKDTRAHFMREINHLRTTTGGKKTCGKKLRQPTVHNRLFPIKPTREPPFPTSGPPPTAARSHYAITTFAILVPSIAWPFPCRFIPLPDSVPPVALCLIFTLLPPSKISGNTRKKLK